MIPKTRLKLLVCSAAVIHILHLTLESFPRAGYLFKCYKWTYFEYFHFYITMPSLLSVEASIWNISVRSVITSSPHPIRKSYSHNALVINVILGVQVEVSHGRTRTGQSRSPTEFDPICGFWQRGGTAAINGWRHLNKASWEGSGCQHLPPPEPHRAGVWTLTPDKQCEPTGHCVAQARGA